jgi:hypothetical protein
LSALALATLCIKRNRSTSSDGRAISVEIGGGYVPQHKLVGGGGGSVRSFAANDTAGPSLLLLSSTSAAAAEAHTEDFSAQPFFHANPLISKQ